ncbi:hypothetical protein GBAR_LOCUS23922 [Geodia barretti]|uniref:Uncharacterized protein n=1 Tax=Geodia barretti TaxID=519541 RepID=A0AA35T7C4_GEOBA|nr:hypothetical protein GBAR_LOCUS23922 [Geodia barretti]
MASKATFAGPSGLCIEATVALTLRSAGNGESTNGSSDTPVRPRKRQRRPETWKRAVAKSKRAKGEEYTSPSTGVTVLSRGTGPDCRCRRRCFDSVSQSERAAILAAFYGLGSKDLQDAHLFGLIQSIPVKRRRPRGDGRTSRRATYTYVVRVAGRSETVCQKAFASLYGVSVSRVRRIAQATSTSICAPVDKRGKHPRRSRIQLGGEVKEQIRQHIKSVPALKSHYSSGKSKARKYLSPLLSVAEMHRLYVEKHESNSETPLVKYSYYAKILTVNSILHLEGPR